jgi:hypothetical protein
MIKIISQLLPEVNLSAPSANQAIFNPALCTCRLDLSIRSLDTLPKLQGGDRHEAQRLTRVWSKVGVIAH